MNENEEKEFESLIEIDKTRLDEESENQPRLVWAYGKMYAKALLDLDGAAANLKVVEADMDAEVREDPQEFGLDKITEPGVKKAILRSREHKDAITALNKANYRVHMIEAANKTLDHRRTSLSNLNSQDERNYFSRPRESNRRDMGKSVHRKPLRKRHKT